MDVTIRVDSVGRFHEVSMKKRALCLNCLLIPTTDRAPNGLGYSRITFLCDPRKDYIGTMHFTLRLNL